jgi:glycosyltransferase involved in cell wall biosynthesis
MEKKSLLSVIIPVYKTEKYLRRCLDSLCNQTYSNLEILVVNDGSPDNCLSILMEYAQKDKRVIVLDKENGGVNTARNLALTKANGEWISFVDSDDWLDLDYYQQLMIHTSQDTQLTCGGFRLNEDGIIYKSINNQLSLNRIEGLEVLFQTYFGMIYNVWGKVFRKDIILENKLLFRSFLREDGIFLMDYFQYINNLNILSTTSYLHYNTENINSITHKTYGIERIMLDLYKYHNSIAKLSETDYSNYDRYDKIQYMDKTLSFCNIMHETYPLPFKQKLYWYKRMIDQLPHFSISYLSPYLNKPIHKCLKLAFNARSPFFIYCVIKIHLLNLRIKTKFYI